MKKLCVIGSLNVDLTITIPRFHAPGESIIGSDFHTFTGGKGGNQAVALGRLGAEVSMVGMLGDDENGRLYLRKLAAERVDASLVGVSSVPTGVALIEVDASSGDNRIAVAAGANNEISRAHIDRVWSQMLACDVFLLQLEMPMDTVCYVTERLHAAGKTVVLDPAPAQPLPETLLRCADYITPNETELSLITQQPTGTLEEIRAAAAALRARGAKAVVAKMGARGSMLFREDELYDPGFRVQAVDTTAAGDSFNAGFAYALAQGLSEARALELGNAVGALATTSMGAQAAMPGMDRARQLIAGRT